MDYLFHKGLSHNTYERVVVSYDIACQWKRHFTDRMARKFPSDWFINTSTPNLVFLVPKFHLPAHIDVCHDDYSFNNHKNVARTDGEAPERGWSRVNDLASSTREMGPGARRDKLEDHMGDSNWKKTILFGMYFVRHQAHYNLINPFTGRSLLNKLKAAIPEHRAQRDILDKLEEVLDSSNLSIWRTEVEAWELDSTKQNPFRPRVRGE
jgi:hypothetical protein